MRDLQLHTRKNDLCFAFLMLGVFAVTIAGAGAGHVDLARGRLSADSTKTRGASVALHGTREQTPRIARAVTRG